MNNPSNEPLPSRQPIEKTTTANAHKPNPEQIETDDRMQSMPPDQSAGKAPHQQSGWKLFWVALQILQVRLRFILLLVVLGLAIGYWDTLKNYWDKWTRPPRAASAAAAQEIEYYCPMHPQVVRAEPGNCPICGMPLSKRKKGESTAVQLPEGVLSRTQYSPYRIALAGIHTSEVRYLPLTRDIVTVGYVDYDQTRRSQIVLRAAGYIEKLYVDQTWMIVEKGTPLAEVYSPELYSAAEELLIATEGGKSDGLAKAARERIRLLGVSPEEITQIEQSRRANERLLIRSPQHGFVIAKDVLEGRYIPQGQIIYDIADLDVVWIEADIYEKDISFLREGLELEATTEAFPTETFQGRVSVIYQQLNPTTRTERVRLEIQNPDLKLRPGMYATVRIHVPMTDIEPFKTVSAQAKPGEVLAVPISAVIDTGKQRVVYVERQGGQFDGVAVELGPRSGNYYPVVAGLAPGDKVATAGAFLLDAETRLNPGAAAAYFGASGGPQSQSKATETAPATQTPPFITPSPSATAPDNRTNTQTPNEDPMVRENLVKLTPQDRLLAQQQLFCPITGQPLGSMGEPYKIELNGYVVFLCCQGCESEAKANPTQTLEKIDELKKTTDKSRSNPQSPIPNPRPHTHD